MRLATFALRVHPPHKRVRPLPLLAPTVLPVDSQPLVLLTVLYALLAHTRCLVRLRAHLVRVVLSAARLQAHALAAQVASTVSRPARLSHHVKNVHKVHMVHPLEVLQRARFALWAATVRRLVQLPSPAAWLATPERIMR